MLIDAGGDIAIHLPKDIVKKGVLPYGELVFLEKLNNRVVITPVTRYKIREEGAHDSWGK